MQRSFILEIQLQKQLQIKDLTVASVLETTSKTRQTNVLHYRNESD